MEIGDQDLVGKLWEKLRLRLGELYVVEEGFEADLVVFDFPRRLPQKCLDQVSTNIMEELAD